MQNTSHYIRTENPKLFHSSFIKMKVIAVCVNQLFLICLLCELADPGVRGSGFPESSSDSWPASESEQLVDDEYAGPSVEQEREYVEFESLIQHKFPGKKIKVQEDSVDRLIPLGKDKTTNKFVQFPIKIIFLIVSTKRFPG